MAYKIEKLETEPIAILTILGGVEGRQEGMQISDDITALVEQHDGKLYLILDYAQLVTNFSSIVAGLAAALLSGAGMNPVLAHPRLQCMVVGTSSAASLWATAMSQKQYGGKGARLFPTLDEALAHIRAEVGSTPPSPQATSQT